MRQDRQTVQTRAIYLVAALLALANGGCLLVAAGAAAGGAAGYAYYRGKLSRGYVGQCDTVWTATNTALAQLGMPLLRQERTATGGWIETRTADDGRVRISLEEEPSKIPSDPPITHVGIRVGTFGDDPVSNRILDQIAVNLTSPRSPPLANPSVVPTSFTNSAEPERIAPVPSAK
jgi:hypothetical protein